MNEFTIARLGNVFSCENIKELEDNLSKMGLPKIPSEDITFDEMTRLLAYHGNQLAYLHANLELVTMEEKKLQAEYTKIYNKIYQSIEAVNSKNKITTIKALVTQSPEVVEANKKVLEIQSTIASINAHIVALQEQNISLRKIASIKTIALQHGLE